MECLGHVLITPFTQISLIILNKQVHIMPILHDEHFVLVHIMPILHDEHFV